MVNGGPLSISWLQNNTDNNNNNDSNANDNGNGSNIKATSSGGAHKVAAVIENYELGQSAGR